MWRFGLDLLSVLMKKSEGKRTLRKPRVCWEDIIKVAISSRCVECFGEEICRKENT